ncbi:UPF0280 family protein [Pararhodobacter oceanensis]|uniref:Uncharacterized protein n=1 Tax=Pararhodobacter oceanensis TaxID=2172121 RepID=A0A2T8HRM2_9RHOB|nr:UPF0280 family protein [Pararhodobacter oceanensis]PVH28081.1 hypothetical protein DDE20_13230 [Pararhodobacter oceanensis]
MMQAPHHRMLPDGRRLHLGHGPIDLIVQAEGAPDAVAEGYRRAVARFDGLLEELVAELPLLRRPVQGDDCPLQGPIAKRMWQAARGCMPEGAPLFVTPMAAVAGAVAEAVLAAISEVPGLTRASVNNGGDIALYLASDAPDWRLAVVVDPQDPASPGVLRIGPKHSCRGVASSGAKGRSHSLGIADSVTVLAKTAPEADVAATLIANAVDLPDHPAITRQPACVLAPDSDLGAALVTTHVGALTAKEITQALDAGETLAESLLATRRIHGAALVLQGRVRLVGDLPLHTHGQVHSVRKLHNV